MKLSAAKKLALQTMQEHLSDEWKFQFDDSARRFGYCSYRKKTISLSRQLVKLNNPLQIYDTILHEVAHALIEPGNGHNKLWKQTASSIGCSATRTYPSTVNKPKPKYKATCSSCKHEYQYMVMRRKAACGHCCSELNFGKYTTRYILEWEKL